MHSLVAARAAPIQIPPAAGELSKQELDSIVGGITPLGIAVLVFFGSVAVGIVDRILFGGCRCRE